MRKDSFPTFKKLLKNTRKIAIVTHWNPDGDAVGSSLGLFHFLKKLGKQVQVIVPNAFPDFLEWLPGSRGIINFSAQGKKAAAVLNSADLIFTLDFNSFKRLEKLGEVLAASKTPMALIDHHPEPDAYARYYFHDKSACSTSELVFELIGGLGQKKLLDRKSASCLYTGMMTDSGSFRYPCVSSKTHLVISELLRTGIKPSDIHSAVYDNYSLDRLRLLGYALSIKMTLVEDLPAAYISLNGKELQQFNYKKGDTEGLVNYPFSIKGIKVSALFTEAADHIRISLRSKGKVDVNKFARAHFNGGGHLNAAGGKSYQGLEETVDKFRGKVKELF